MVRTHIQLHDEQYRRLRRWARQLGVSLSEAVRRCVADRLAHDGITPSREDQVRSALTVCGKYADRGGRSQVARDHERHLATAYRR